MPTNPTPVTIESVRLARHRVSAALTTLQEIETGFTEAHDAACRDLVKALDHLNEVASQLADVARRPEAA
jgi:hypothetical protein